MQYLRNAQSDFDPVFFYLFVFSSSVTYVKTEKMVFTPPPPPSGLKQEVFFSGEECVPQWAADLRNQVEGIKEVLGMQEASSEATSSDDQA